MKRILLKFAKDEDGVALAFGITFFLLVFLVGMSIYAAGETVRQRMELQNAADAAAYSGAAVQADTLSRVACINQAMSWTYVMMNRRIMDYITDKWLEKVEREWNSDQRSVREMWNWLSTCGTRIQGTDYWVGFGGMHKQIFLNNSQMVGIDTIKMQRKAAAAMGKGYKQLSSYIDRDRKTLKAMHQAEKNLLSELPKRIEKAVKHAIEENISGTPNDDAAGGAGISYVLLQNDPSTYTEIMKNQADQEKCFLVFGGFQPQTSEISSRGTDKWWTRSPSGEGFHREYSQKSSLSAQWQWFGIQYILTGEACVPTPKMGANQVRGQDVRNGYFRCSERAKPYRLTEDFFGRKGTILVGLKRKLNNPFAFLFANGKPEGLFSAFSIKDGRSMWTASAARAGYASPTKQRSRGAYESTFMDVADRDTWNLCEQDWDALLLPVAIAFDKGRNRKFTKGDKEPLQQVYQELNPGALSAPAGMTAGGEFEASHAREALHH